MSDVTSNITTGATDLTRMLRGLVPNDGESRIIQIDPAVAWRILDEMNFHGQRRVKKGRVAERLEAIQTGSWEPAVSEITIAELPDGSMYLIDGQHRLYAIFTHGKPVRSGVKIVKADDEDHARRMYTLFDIKTSSRSESELVSAANLPELLGIKQATANSVISAIGVIENGMEPTHQNSGQVNQFKFRHEQAVYWDREARKAEQVMDAADGAMRKKLRRAGTTAVMLYTLRHQPELAEEFWMGVAEGDALRKNDPRNKLRLDMLTRYTNTGSARQVIQQPALAWNAFFEGRDLKIIKCIEGAGIVLSGTPMRRGGAK